MPGGARKAKVRCTVASIAQRKMKMTRGCFSRSTGGSKPAEGKRRECLCCVLPVQRVARASLSGAQKIWRCLQRLRAFSGKTWGGHPYGGHIRPRSKYPHLALRLDNLQLLCHDCNLAKATATKLNGVSRGLFCSLFQRVRGQGSAKSLAPPEHMCKA